MQPAPHPNWRKSLVLAALFLGIAALGWFLLEDSRARSRTFLMRGDPGPFFLAELCLGLILLGGLVMLARAGLEFRRRDHSPILPSWRAVDALRWLVPALFVLTIIAMPGAMRALGTPVALGSFALVWIAVLMYLAGYRGMSLALGPVLGALATAGFIQFVFIRLLNLPLPI